MRYIISIYIDDTCKNMYTKTPKFPNKYNPYMDFHFNNPVSHLHTN